MPKYILNLMTKGINYAKKCILASIQYKNLEHFYRVEVILIKYVIVMEEIKSVDVKTLSSWLEKDLVQLVDVREVEEYQSGKIEKAVNLPLSKFYQLFPDFKIEEGKYLVMQCGVGRRSLSVCEMFKKENISKDLYNLEGGINAWVDSGYQIIQQPKLKVE